MNCYNGARYLNDSLRSIINQTFQNWELLFWDNRSTDNSKKILESFKETRFKYYMSPKFTNLGEARYLASKHIYGDLLAILDTDDVWLPNKLEEQVNIFNKNQDLGLIYTNTIFFDKKNNHTLYSKKQNSGNLFNHLLFNYNISLETVLINLKYKNKIKYLFDKNFEFISDFDLILRLSKISKFYYLNRTLAKWRIHENNLTFQKPNLFTIEKLIWIKKMLSKDTFNKRIYLQAYKKYKVEYCYSLMCNNEYNYQDHLMISGKALIKTILVYINYYLPFTRSFFSRIIKLKK